MTKKIVAKQRVLKVNVGLPEVDALAISNMVREGRYATLSDFVRQAVKLLLEKQK